MILADVSIKLMLVELSLLRLSV